MGEAIDVLSTDGLAPDLQAVVDGGADAYRQWEIRARTALLRLQAEYSDKYLLVVMHGEKGFDLVATADDISILGGEAYIRALAKYSGVSDRRPLHICSPSAFFTEVSEWDERDEERNPFWDGVRQAACVAGMVVPF